MSYTYTVSIPHYNSPHLLKRMLKSIPEREDIQVIVIDDGSSAENVNVIKTLQHKNLELVLLAENKGGGHARNEGLRRAAGKWFVSVDSDDFFSEDAFEVFDQYKDEEIECLYYCVQCIDAETGVVTRELKSDIMVRKYLDAPSEKTEKYLRFHNRESWNKLVSMKFIRDNNICYENCRVNIDVFYALSIGLKVKKYKAIHNKLYFFTENSNSITHKKRNLEREFQFFLQVQKRNGFYEKLGLKHYPFYRRTILYIPHMLKKRGLSDTIKFFKMIKERKQEITEARKAYLYLFDE